jgi:ACS family pantothenate transporter-like MFS transporter
LVPLVDLLAMFNFALQLFGTACLVVWKIPLGMHVVAYLLAACDGPLSPLYMAWANLLCGKDKQVRAMTLSMMNAFGNATTTIIQQLAYPVLDAPQYEVGFRTSLSLICGMVGRVFVVRYCEMKVQRTRSEAAGQVAEEIALDQSIDVRPEKAC